MGEKIIYQLNTKNNSQCAENKRVPTNQNTTKFPYQPSNDMGNSKLKHTSLYEFITMFPDEESARKYFELKRWNGNVRCPHCGRHNITECKNQKPMPYRCRDCRKFFSVRFGTILEESKLPLHKWLFCMYLLYTSRKGISSIQVAKTLGVTQKTAWFLCHRIREVWMKSKKEKLDGIVEVDEAYFGGKEKNKHNSQRRGWGRGPSGKQIVIGAKQRNGNVIVKHIDDTSAYNLQGFINKHVEKKSNVFTDKFRSYKGLTGFVHEFVNHSGKQYVHGNVHTNSIESFWSLLKRGYYGVYHYMSGKHLKRYIHEFSYRHNTSKVETMDFIGDTITKMIGKRIMYCDLVSQ